jgi:hypothetical protein
MGDEKLAAKAAADYKKALTTFEAKFWDPASGQYSYAFNAEGKQVKELTPWCAVPLMWGIGGAERTAQTLEKMGSSDLTTDWGVRILSANSPLYEPLNYNYGAVWPFLTGYAVAAMYKNDYCLQGYQLLLANAEHLFDNSLGHVTELFSGSQHVWPQEAVAHQGFSIGGFVLPFVRGMLGLDGNAVQKEVVFAPCFPPDWRDVSVENVRVGAEIFSAHYLREDAKIRLEVKAKPGTSYTMIFSPALGLGTQVRSARLNGKPLDFKINSSGQVIRPMVRFSLRGQDVVEIDFDPTVEILPPTIESRVGDGDMGLKVVRLRRAGKDLQLTVEGLAGESYKLDLTNSNQVEKVTGAELAGNRLLIQMPQGKPREFLRKDVVLNLR